jgi:beta-N-acetylhexosaminidase
MWKVGTPAVLAIVLLLSTVGAIRLPHPAPRFHHALVARAAPGHERPAAEQPVSERLVAALAVASAQARHRLLLQAAANWYLARMSLDDQLGQMLMNESDGTVYSWDMATMVERQHVTGIILFYDNYGTFAQTQALLHTIQAHAQIPLLLATDQEGGTITRISQYYGWFPWPQDLANSGDLQRTYNAGRQAAQDLQQLGVNADFSPVVDVPLNDSWAWTTARAFSEDPGVVARFAGAYMAGITSAGEISCLKHFPGIGSVAVDPHEGLPLVTRSLSQLWQSELYPYQALIPQMPPMIMSTDVLVPAVDPVYPAELSRAWITGILRGQLHYEGVVITDALWMKGISERWGEPEAAVLAVLAGNDIVIAAYNASLSQQVLAALKSAVAAGRIPSARIQDSVRRILMLKVQFGLLPIPAALQTSDHLVDQIPG